MNNSGMWFSF